MERAGGIQKELLYQLTTMGEAEFIEAWATIGRFTLKPQAEKILTSGLLTDILPMNYNLAWKLTFAWLKVNLDVIGCLW